MAAVVNTYSQEQDDSTTTFERLKAKGADIFHQAMESIKKTPDDTSNNASSLLAKSEESFKKYEGKYIRHIVINQLGFEKKLADTSKYLVTVGTKIYNHLHVNTRDWVILNNVYLKEGTQVYAYEVADNERYLRTLDFIQDARILIKPVKGEPDSVDVMIVSKDLFTITGDLDASGFRRAKLRIADANFMGMGQRLQVTPLFDVGRQPRFGYEVLYKKVNTCGSFVDVTVAYSQINTGSNIGNEDESSSYIRLERPLYSPYAHFAGGLLLSSNRSVNVYNKPDTVFLNYAYKTLDAWMGYNIQASAKTRDKKFVAIRYLNNSFDHLPYQVGERFDPIYNSREAVLGEVSFFRQDFFKTNYIYGFGTTEDLPYGYAVSAIGGWYKQNGLERPYTGIDANKYIASGAGEFYQFFLRTGGFYHDHDVQDGTVLVGGSVFTRLMEPGNFKLRQYFRASYARLFNPLIYEPLRIDNQLGIKDFGADSVTGNMRINAYAETVLFTKYKVLGFRIAPYIFLNGALMKPQNLNLNKADIYTGIGGGARVRNENLVFGTVELRMEYFPRTAYGSHEFKIALNSGISFRYRNSYVNAPDILRLNTDDYVY